MVRVFLYAALVALALVCSAVVPGADSALALTLTVNDPADQPDAIPGDGFCATLGGACTLRAAVQEANANVAVDTINVPAGIYPLSLGQIIVNPVVSHLTIRGANAAGTIIDGQGIPTSTSSRIFQILTGRTVTMEKMTLQNATLAAGASGGAIDMQDATLTLDDVVVQGNTAAGGGGIRSRGTQAVLTIRNSIIRDNRTLQFTGGGISSSDGRVLVEDSQILNNKGTSGGGGIQNLTSTSASTVTAHVTIVRTRIEGNEALLLGTGSGGAIGNSGHLTLTDVVVRNNTAATTSGGLANGPTSAMLQPINVALTRVIVDGNTSPSPTLGGAAGVGGGAGVVMTITDSSITGNSTGASGGGASGSADFTLNNVLISGNRADANGGGMIASGPSRLTNVVITGNRAGVNNGGFSAGGSSAGGGNATLTNVTISDNSAGAEAGGLRVGGSNVGGATATLTNVTISGNTAGTAGGGLRVNNPGPAASASLTNVTIANNGAATGGGISVASGHTLQLKNTLISAGPGGTSCDGVLASTGGNLSSDASCAASLTQPSDQNNANPLLAALADNGGAPAGAPTDPARGPTKTHALMSGSAAIDKAIGCPPPATDQRGVSRPRDGEGDGVATCDVGAFEAPQVAAAEGKVTGGGTVDTSGGVANFGFNAQRKLVNGPVSGNLEYGSGAGALKSTAMTSLVVSGNSATFGGTCTRGGVPCTFTVTVVDNGEPGRNDRFVITIDGQPPEGGQIRGGNIQVHK